MGSRFQACATLRGSEDERQDDDDYEQTDQEDHADGAADELEHGLVLLVRVPHSANAEARRSRGNRRRRVIVP